MRSQMQEIMEEELQMKEIAQGDRLSFVKVGGQGFLSHFYSRKK